MNSEPPGGVQHIQHEKATGNMPVKRSARGTAHRSRTSVFSATEKLVAPDALAALRSHVVSRFGNASIGDIVAAIDRRRAAGETIGTRCVEQIPASAARALNTTPQPGAETLAQIGGVL